jgi:hypothetical protein
MSKHRRAAKIDANQPEIVDALRDTPGVTVQLGMDDILVGYKGVTYWYEIKDPAKLFNKDGSFRKGEIKPSQEKLLAEWKGRYKIVWSIEMILEDIGI